MASEPPAHDLRNSVGLEAAPPNPAGLEVRPGHGLIASQDDDKMGLSEKLGQIEQRPQKRYCGMTAKTLWIVLAVILVVVIAVAVGAGVGASKHSKTSSTQPASTSITPAPATSAQPSSTSSSTTSTSSASAASATPVDGGCTNGTIYKSTNNTPFAEVCNTDFKCGEDFNTTAADWNLVQNMASFNACMDACAVDRSQGVTAPDVAGQCLSVTWISNEKDKGFGDCWMKNSTALIGSGNKTELMEHTVPLMAPGKQSASIVGKDGQPL